jgi:dTMP kinase
MGKSLPAACGFSGIDAQAGAMFITLEGSEGSGKTTQIAALADYLTQLGCSVLTTREPGGTQISEQIRTILHSLENSAMQPRTEMLLYQASRAQLVDEVIRPHLAAGGVVISDRYADSTLAYQGYGRQLNLDQLGAIIEFATGGLKPDLTLFLDVDVELGLRRRTKDGNLNRLDILDLAFYHRVRRGYLELVAQEPQRWVVVNADRTPDEIQAELRQIVRSRLKIAADV